MDKGKLELMNQVLKIQGADGNWNYDPYMMGMYNGMELMISLAENREPVFKEAPDEWLDGKTLYFESEQPVESKPFKLTVLRGGKSNV